MPDDSSKLLWKLSLPVTVKPTHPLPAALSGENAEYQFGGPVPSALWPSLFRYNALWQLAPTRSFSPPDHIALSLPSACTTHSVCTLQEREDAKMPRVLRTHRMGPPNR